MNVNKNNNTILIMAGGTGGHVFPALSVAKYLLSKGMNVEWLGTKAGLEASVIGETNIPIHFITVSGLRGKSIWKRFMSPCVISIAFLQSIRKLVKIKPVCVLGMGGFVTGPAGIAAKLLGLKLCIHEQNSIAGFSNQMLSPYADTVMEAFPGAFERKQSITKNKILKLLVKKIKPICVGNPVRQEILTCLQPEQRFVKKSEKLKLFVVGGSLGAVAINKVIPELLALYSNEERPEILHQCGKNNLEETVALYAKCNIDQDENTKIEAFVDDMAAAYAWADLVICRSGALTVSEIAIIGVPSILIPYPAAVDDHQTENAKVLAAVNAAFIIQQTELSANKLSEYVNKFINDRACILSTSLAAKKVAKPNATKNTAEICLEYCRA